MNVIENRSSVTVIERVYSEAPFVAASYATVSDQELAEQLRIIDHDILSGVNVGDPASSATTVARIGKSVGLDPISIPHLFGLLQEHAIIRNPSPSQKTILPFYHEIDGLRAVGAFFRTARVEQKAFVMGDLQGITMNTIAEHTRRSLGEDPRGNWIRNIVAENRRFPESVIMEGVYRA